MAKTYEEIKKYREQLIAEKDNWECLDYASRMYRFVTGTEPAGAGNAIDYWDLANDDERFMHILAPSVPIWFNNDIDGHAGFIEKIDADGTIYYSDANGNRDYKIQTRTFSDPYYLGKAYENFKGYVQRKR